MSLLEVRAHDLAAGLSTWIAPDHFRPENLDGYRRTFAAHPVRLSILRSFLRDDIACRAAEFLEREAEYQPQYGLYSRPSDGQPVTADEWSRAEPGDRFFRFRAVSGVQERFRLGTNVLAYLKIVRALADVRFTAFAETISDLGLGPLHLNVHGMMAGDFLHAHTDARDQHRLAFVLFLSRGWDPAFGGALHLTDGGGGEWTVEPTYNTLALFDISAHHEHWVTPIEAAAGTRARVTIGGWIENRPAR